MNADAEFLKLVREYLEASRCTFRTHTHHEAVEAANARRRLVAAVQEIIQRHSQPGLWEEGK